VVTREAARWMTTYNQHALSVSDDGRVIAGYVGIAEITPAAVMWRCH